MKKIYITITAFLMGVLSTGAQNLNSAYFMDGYKNRHQLNPAFASTRSYLALPVAGGFSAYVQSNLGISNILFPYEDGLTTFMNPNIDSESFLSSLNKNNLFGADYNINVLSVGAWGKKGFTTFELNAKVNSVINLPYDLFSVIKDLGGSDSYNISGLGARSNVYLEFAIGHSASVTKHLNIGAKVKFLAGVANLDAKIDNLNLQMTEDRWSVTADGYVDANIPGLYVPTKAETGKEQPGSARANEVDLGGATVNLPDGGAASILSSVFTDLNWGVAVDLGAEYRFGGILKGLNLSAAILDLGFISWNNGGFSAYTGESSWEFTGFENISFQEGSENTIGKQFEALGKDLSNLIILQKGEAQSRLQMLTCTINLGAEYQLPFWRKLSVGALYSSRIQGRYTKNEGRFFLNLEPSKWLGLSASYGASEYGSSLGGVLSLDFPIVGIFLGTDYIFWDITPPVKDLGNIPLPINKLRLNVNFGLTFNLSKYRTPGDWRD